MGWSDSRAPGALPWNTRSPSRPLAPPLRYTLFSSPGPPSLLHSFFSCRGGFTPPFFGFAPTCLSTPPSPLVARERCASRAASVEFPEPSVFRPATTCPAPRRALECGGLLVLSCVGEGPPLSQTNVPTRFSPLDNA